MATRKRKLLKVIILGDSGCVAVEHTCVCVGLGCRRPLLLRRARVHCTVYVAPCGGACCCVWSKVPSSCVLRCTSSSAACVPSRTPARVREGAAPHAATAPDSHV
jgi:hypothetical protein